MGAAFGLLWAGEPSAGRSKGTSPQSLTSNKVTVNSIRFVVHEKTVEMTMRYTLQVAGESRRRRSTADRHGDPR